VVFLLLCITSFYFLSTFH